MAFSFKGVMALKRRIRRKRAAQTVLVFKVICK
jgi:hypothetical protein